MVGGDDLRLDSYVPGVHESDAIVIGDHDLRHVRRDGDSRQITLTDQCLDGRYRIGIQRSQIQRLLQIGAGRCLEC